MSSCNVLDVCPSPCNRAWRLLLSWYHAWRLLSPCNRAWRLLSPCNRAWSLLSPCNVHDVGLSPCNVRAVCHSPCNVRVTFCLCSCTWPVSARCATSSRTVMTPARRCSRQPTWAATTAWRGGGIPLANRIETSLPGGTALDTRSWLWPTCWKRLAVPSASGVSVNSVADPSKQSVTVLFYVCSQQPDQNNKLHPPPQINKLIFLKNQLY